MLIPRSEGQLGLTITEVVDFSFVFQDPAFLNALALRGLRSAGAAAEGLRHAADAGLVRPARGSAPDRQGADVLHRGRRHQPLRAADRRPAGDHRPRRAPDRQADRHRRRADPGGEPQLRRGERRRALRPAARAEADPHQPAARRQLPLRRQLHRVAEVALPRPLRAPLRAGGLAGELRRPPGDVPGLAGRDLRALPGPEHQLVLPDLHGRGRVRLRPARLAARARARRARERGAARRPGRRGDPRPSGAGRAAAAVARDRRVRAAHRQPGVAPLRAVLERRLRRPRRGRAGGAKHRPGRQLRLPDRLDLHPERRHARRGRADRDRRAEGGRRPAGRAARRRRAHQHAGRGRAGGAISTAITSASGSTSTSTARPTRSSSASCASGRRRGRGRASGR